MIFQSAIPVEGVADCLF